MYWSHSIPVPKADLSRLALAVEFITLFIAGPLALALLFQHVNPVPFLLLGGVAATMYLLRDKGFVRSSFGNLSSLKQQVQRITLIFLLLTLLAIIGIAGVCPDYLFFCPRNNTTFWIITIISYPLLSVYPQEVIYRAFLFRRYQKLFPERQSMIHASALVFAFGHIIFGNLIAIILTLAGGYLFAYTYQRSQSILTASVEHALYGCLVFTIGLGRFIQWDLSIISGL
ncbi:MAG: CPBP family intramembrane glutamic endopeptidase [Thermodesulfobacteriota bacterium]